LQAEKSKEGPAAEQRQLEAQLAKHGDLWQNVHRGARLEQALA